ncbi:MAG: Gfo/Idh/MocA family oxidoreductase [Steroidobacteraceae bacterium]
MHTVSDPGLAIIGTQFGCSGHLRAARLAGFQVRALVGRNAAKTAELARYYRVPTASTSVAEVLGRPEVDAVIVASPPETHRDVCLQAIAAGKHVLCEKPFALNARDADEMLNAARDARVVHQVGHEFRFDPTFTMLRRTLQRGAIGEPRQALFAFDFPLTAAASEDVPQWFRERAHGGGWLHNYGSHVIDLIRWTLGEFLSVSGHVTVGADRGMSADDGYVVSYALTRGVTGVMSASTRAWDPFSIVRVIGSDATLVIDQQGLGIISVSGRHAVAADPDLEPASMQFDPLAPLAADAGMYERVHASDAGMPNMVRQAIAFRSAISGAGELQPQATFLDGLMHVRVIEAILAASDASGVVQVPLPP